MYAESNITSTAARAFPRSWATWALAGLLALTLATPFAGSALAEEYKATDNAIDSTANASAADDERLPAALKGETEIEKATIAYKAALGEVEGVNDKIADLQEDIDEIEAVLPEQQARSDAGMKQRYIMQSNPMVIADSLLESETLGDFLRQTDYLERMSRANLREYNKTRDMKEQLDKAKAEQERLKAEAQDQVNATGAALLALQVERSKKQSDGIAKAQNQAAQQGGKKSVGKKANGVEQPKGFKEAATADTSALSDGADWTADRDEFIAEWSERLDKYLAGSALEGQGKNFAASAWKYCIDPRWSAAISNTESGKGAVCIRAHNAWGWGAADSDPYNLAVEWGSWEEAIDAHAKGLAKGYGYTISMNGAKMYCPITWQSWYNKTLAEMARI